MKYRINPYTQDYGLGGALSGGLSQGASMASAGMAFGPIGAAVGGGLGLILGGISGSKKEDAQNKLAQQQQMAQQKLAQSNYDAGVGSAKVNAYADNVNNLINPVTQGFAYGGMMGEGSDGMFNSTDVSTFEEGGTHEENPLGGIPQGVGPNGKVNTTEENEVKVQLSKDESYIFSDRLIFE